MIIAERERLVEERGEILARTQELEEAPQKAEHEPPKATKNEWLFLLLVLAVSTAVYFIVTGGFK